EARRHSCAVWSRKNTCANATEGAGRLPTSAGSVRAMSAELVELAEEPGLWVPVVAPGEVLHRDGYSLVASPRTASVERLRLLPDAIEWTVEEVRRFGRERGYEYVTWWLGERTLPARLAGRLTALRLRPPPPTPRIGPP